jgi:hypothetical protein
VGDQPKRLLDGLQLSIEHAIIEQLATALGLDNPQAKPRRQRKPSLTRFLAKAKQLGVDVTIEPTGAVTFRTGNSASAPSDSPQNEVDEWISTHAH